MSLRVFNTMTGQKEPFQPIREDAVGMYVCGVTVYDLCHIGHARSAIVFDTIYRYLKYKGYPVTYVRNFTDIDDKIIKRANEEDIGWQEVTEKYIAAFYEDMDRLNIARPDVEPKATDHIQEMLDLIDGLIKKDRAYEMDGDVYFAVRAFPEYGKLSGKNVDDLRSGARVDVDDRKRDPLDFALWKKSKEGEPAWNSPWGPGRPGWHIECSAMSEKYLGKYFDIHGGGKDLVFPHHENEIAQSCGCSGEPFVKTWLHNGFVNINEEKMSKSLGNFFTIRDLLEKFHPEVLRLFLLTNHYRGPIDFADSYLDESKKMIDKFYKLIDKAEEGMGFPIKKYAEDLMEKKKFRSSFVEKFETAMDDDFNTALAIGHMNENLTDINSKLSRIPENSSERHPLFDEIAAFYYCGKNILGLFKSSSEALTAIALKNLRTKKFAHSFEALFRHVESFTGSTKLADLVKILKDNNALQNSYIDKFEDALKDDGNTDLALEVMNEELKRLEEKQEKPGDFEKSGDPEINRPYTDFNDEVARLYFTFDSWINIFIEKRKAAREAKDWPEADRLRDELTALGVVLEDTPKGTIWTVK